MKINKFHRTYKKITPANGFMTEDSKHRLLNDRCMAPYVVCADGFTMSVQASGTHYCEPRRIAKRYRSFEIGFPSHEESLLMDYCEDPSRPCDTVYSNVPVRVIDIVIENHGGIDIDATMARHEEYQNH